MKLVLLVFIVLCNDFKVGSDESADKCYKIFNRDNLECCNQKTFSNPCSTVKCGDNTECVLHHVPEIPPNCTSDFPLVPRCEQPCPMLKCASYCVPAIDGNTRCPACYCDEKNKFENPCLKKDACDAGQECKLIKVTCALAPCYPVKECLPICPPKEVCPENCLSYVDQNGCKKCHCCNACVNKVCPEGMSLSSNRRM